MLSVMCELWVRGIRSFNHLFPCASKMILCYACVIFLKIYLNAESYSPIKAPVSAFLGVGFGYYSRPRLLKLQYNS